MRRIFFCLSLFTAGLFAEDCPRLLIDSAAVISAEGSFINREHSRIHVDVMWQHQPNTADTFDISIAGTESYRYVSAKNFRYMEFKPENVLRQMAMHHLKEYIGESSLKWDDLELLSQGAFLCPDSIHNDSTLLYSTYSQAWFNLKVGTSAEPDSILMNGPKDDDRRIFIHSWRPYDGMNLPAILDIQGLNYLGTLWIRTAHKVKSVQAKKLKKSVPADTTKKTGDLFLWNRPDVESKVPLILQMQ